MNKQDIIILGCNGQVGRSFKTLLGQTDYTFHFYDRSTCDISDRAMVKSVLSDFGSGAVVVNCAAYTQVDLAEEDQETCFLINHIAVEHIAQITKELDQLFVHISSDYVYNPTHTLPLVETDSLAAMGVYAESKRLGETAARQNPRHYIFRTSWVYHEEGNNFVNTMIRLGKKLPALKVVHDQIGSPTYAPHIAHMIFDVIRHNTTAYGTYNFSDDGYISWYTFAQEIMGLNQLDCKVSPIPSVEYPTKAPRPLNSRMSKDLIRSTFQINILPWQIGLKKCIARQQEHVEKD